jgi:hypothetical protein
MSTDFKWSHPHCVCTNWNKGDLSNTTRYVAILLFIVTSMQHVSILISLHQAVQVFIKHLYSLERVKTCCLNVTIKKM